MESRRLTGVFQRLEPDCASVRQRRSSVHSSPLGIADVEGTLDDHSSCFHFDCSLNTRNGSVRLNPDLGQTGHPIENDSPRVFLVLIRFVAMRVRSPNPNERLTRAIHSLQGLSCGDAFGERFFVHPDVAHSLIAHRAVPSGPWRYTDDTAMAIDH